MKKILFILLTLFLCASCCWQEELLYSSDVFLKNNTGRVIEVMKGEKGGRVLLKKWSIGEREQPGKQLYRLSDSELMVHHEHGWGEVFIMYDYIIIVKPDDIGL